MLSTHMHGHALHSHTQIHTCQAILSRSGVVVSLDDAREDWKSAWVIAKVIDRLTRLHAPISTENYLSFIQWLQPSSSHKSFTCCLLSGCGAARICNCTYVCVCVCVCVCGHGVSATGDPYMAVSTRWRGGFVLSVFPRGSIRLCCVSDGNQRLRRGSQKSHFTPLNAKLLLSLHHTVKAPSNTSPEFSIPSVFFFPRAH